MDRLLTTKLLLGVSSDDEDALIQLFLDIAQQALLTLRYGSPDRFPEVPPTGDFYDIWVCKAAVELYNRQGSEGELAHGSSGGLNRTYQSAELSLALRSQIRPIGTVVKGGS
jgi:hypothetical protein